MISFRARFFGAAVALSLLLVGCEDSTEPATQRPSGVRIVSLAPHITELAFAAGAGEQLVATVEYSDYPAGASSVPLIGDAFRIDYEALAVLQPSVVFGWRGGNPADMLQKLHELDYNLVELSSDRLAAIPDNLETIGRAAGTDAVASEAAEQLRGRIAELRSRPVPAKRLRVFWQISANPYYSLTGQHVVSEILDICGGDNVFADLPGLAAVVTLEGILAAEPEVIIASVPPDNDEWKNDWRKWQELPAVKQDNLFAVHPDLVSRSGPRIVDGAERVCAALDAARD